MTAQEFLRPRDDLEKLRRMVAVLSAALAVMIVATLMYALRDTNPTTVAGPWPGHRDTTLFLRFGDWMIEDPAPLYRPARVEQLDD